MANCIERLKEQYPQLTDRELSRLSETFDNLKARHGADVSAYREVSKKAVDEFQLARMNDLKSTIRDTGILHKSLNHIYQPQFLNNPVEGIISIMSGTNRNVGNKWYNTDALRQAYETELEDFFFSSLKNDGVLSYLMNPKNESAIVKAYDNLNSGFKDSKNPAEVTAYHIGAINHNLLIKQQRSGSTIQGTSKYLFMQTHNPDMILANPGKWVEDIVDKLDLDRSFGTGTTRNQALAKLHEMAEDVEDIGNIGVSNVKGGRRELHFTDSTQFLEYNKEWGYTNLAEGLKQSISRAARKSALHETLGSDPRRTLQQLIDTAAEVQKTPFNTKAIQKVWDHFDYVSGMGNRIGEGVSENSMEAINFGVNMEALQLLGSANFAAMEDFATTVLSAKLSNGRPIPIAAVETLFRGIQALGSSKKDIMEMTGIALEGANRELMDLMGSPNNIKGSILGKINSGAHKLIRWQMALTGVNAVTNHTRKTASLIHVHGLTKSVTAKKPNTWQQQSLAAAGLEQGDIDNLRKLMELSGETKVTIKLLRNADPNNLIPVNAANTPENRAIYRQRLKSKIQAYYHHMVNATASPVMQARQAVTLQRHLPRNHPTRLAVNAFAQFQSVLMKIGESNVEVARASNPAGELNNFSAYKSLAGAMAFMGGVAYATKLFKDFAKGEEIDMREKMKPENFIKDYARAMVDSGGGGVYIQALNATVFPREGQRAGARLPSPLADHLAQGFDIGADAVTGNLTEKKTRRFIYRSLPFQNVWFFGNEIKRSYIKNGL